MSDVSIRLDSRALADLLRGPSGPVVRYMTSKAERVQELAKEKVGYDADKAPGEEGGEHLRDTIVKRAVEGPRGVEILVGSEHERALMHHEGTAPHPIDASKAKTLHFSVSGVEVFVTHVDHPGTRPNPYLVDALDQVMRESP